MTPRTTNHHACRTVLLDGPLVLLVVPLVAARLVRVARRARHRPTVTDR